MANSVSPDETAGSVQFAKVSVLVCRDERVNDLLLQIASVMASNTGPEHNMTSGSTILHRHV